MNTTLGPNANPSHVIPIQHRLPHILRASSDRSEVDVVLQPPTPGPSGWRDGAVTEMNGTPVPRGSRLRNEIAGTVEEEAHPPSPHSHSHSDYSKRPGRMRSSTLRRRRSSGSGRSSPSSEGDGERTFGRMRPRPRAEPVRGSSGIVLPDRGAGGGDVTTTGRQEEERPHQTTETHPTPTRSPFDFPLSSAPGPTSHLSLPQPKPARTRSSLVKARARTLTLPLSISTSLAADRGRGQGSPVSPTNGSVGIGPALGIARAGARLRAITTAAATATPTDPSPSSSPPSTPLASPATTEKPDGNTEKPDRRRTQSLDIFSSSPHPQRSHSRAAQAETGSRTRTDNGKKLALGKGNEGSPARETRLRLGLGRGGEGSPSGSLGSPGVPTRVGVHFPPPTEEESINSKEDPVRSDGRGKRTRAGTRGESEVGGRTDGDGRKGTNGGMGSETEKERSRARSRSKGRSRSRSRSRSDTRDGRGGDEETEREQNHWRGKTERQRGRTRGNVDMGFEALFEMDGAGRERMDDPLQALLASVDINNALRLISQTTLLPGGRQAVLPNPDLDSRSPSYPSPAEGIQGTPGRERRTDLPEIFVPKAPPAVTAAISDTTTNTSTTASTTSPEPLGRRKNGDHEGTRLHLSHKLRKSSRPNLQDVGEDAILNAPPQAPQVKTRSRRGTMIERDLLGQQPDPLLFRRVSNDSSLRGDEESTDEGSDRSDPRERAVGSGRKDGSNPARKRDSLQGSVSSSGQTYSETFRSTTPASQERERRGTPEGHLRIEPTPTQARFVPGPKRKKRLSDLFVKHKRSVSGGGAKWKPEPSRERERRDPERERIAYEIEMRNEAEHDAKVQAILHQLPSHPRAEALAYQMRSHFQAYYGLMIRSVEDSAGRPGQRYLRWNPLRVIRWRKQVLAEENRRQVWDAGVNQQLEAHSRLIDGNNGFNRANGVSTWVKNVKEPMAIQANRSHHLTKPSSAPLKSAVALSRALSTDPQAALAARKSTVLKEWTVLPSEIIAFLDCRGNVDYFVPSSDLAQAALTDGLNTSSHNQSDITQLFGANKRIVGESPNMMGMSPGSYDSSFGNKSTVSFVSDMQDTPSDKHDSEDGLRVRKSITRRLWPVSHRDQSDTSRESLDTGERLVHVLKSPIAAIRKHVLHPENEGDTDEGQGDAHHLGQGRLRRIVRSRHGPEENGPTNGHQHDLPGGSPNPTPADHLPPLIHPLDSEDDFLTGRKGSKTEYKQSTSHVEAVPEEPETIDNSTANRRDIELDGNYVKHKSLLLSTGNALDRMQISLAPAATKFTLDVQVLKQATCHLVGASGFAMTGISIPEFVLNKGKAEHQSTIPGHSSKTENQHLPKRQASTSSDGLLHLYLDIPNRPMLRVRGKTEPVDPLSALEESVTKLAEVYDGTLPQAIQLAQRQDDLQDEISSMTTRAERLKMKLDVDANGKIRRNRAQLESMRMPTSRSVDNWFYSLLKYLFNSLLAIIRVLIYIQRFVLLIWRICRAVFMTPYRLVMGIWNSMCRLGRLLITSSFIRTILILVVWTVLLLKFVVQ